MPVLDMCKVCNSLELIWARLDHIKVLYEVWWAVLSFSIGSHVIDVYNYKYQERRYHLLFQKYDPCQHFIFII